MTLIDNVKAVACGHIDRALYGCSLYDTEETWSARPILNHTGYFEFSNVDKVIGDEGGPTIKFDVPRRCRIEVAPDDDDDTLIC
jgi:hypothetical protein